VPAAGWESTANLTNLFWHLLFPRFWVLVDRPISTPRTAAWAALAAVSALSNPLTAVFAPIALWNARGGRPVRRRIVAAVFLGSILIHGIIVASVPQSMTVETRVSDLPGLFGLRVSGSLLAGERLLPELWSRWGAGVAAGAALTVVVFLALGWLFGGRKVQPSLSLGILSWLLFSIPVWFRGTALLRSEAARLNLLGSRWVIAPILFLAAALLVALRSPPVSERPRQNAVRRLLLGMVSSILIAGLLTSYRVTNHRSIGPRWRQQMRLVESQCETGSFLVAVPIAPPGWNAEVECAWL
jgi:hypothetical protein